MKNNFYERYMRGFHNEVWGEIRQLDEKNSFEDFEDIQLLVKETMFRVKFNLEFTYTLLSEMGYKFHNSTPFSLTSPNIEEKLIQLEEFASPYGYLPLSLKEFYRQIGKIDFVPAHDFLESYFADYALVIDDIDNLLEYATTEYAFLSEETNKEVFDMELRDRRF